MADSVTSNREYLNKIFSEKEPSKTTKMYDNWSANYAEAMEDIAYIAPQQLMENFDKLKLPQGAKILDVCAGTGAIGKALVKRGYTDNHAVDGSGGMLAKAREEGNYKSCTHLLFTPGTKLPFADCEFDCVLLAGAFCPGHLPIVALHEFCRVTKVGGVVAWSMCDPKQYEDKDPTYKDGGFYKVVNEIKDKGLWKEREGFPVPVPYIEYSGGFVMAMDVVSK